MKPTFALHAVLSSRAVCGRVTFALHAVLSSCAICGRVTRTGYTEVLSVLRLVRMQRADVAGARGPVKVRACLATL